MKPLAQIRAVKESREDDLLKLPGVNGVDIGPKIVQGKRTGEMSIRVYVDKKKKVPSDQMIPPEIDGIKTDVIEHRFVRHPAAPAPSQATPVENRVPVENLRPMADTATYDPLLGGISIGPCTAVGGYVYVGTLGCLVKDRATNAHLMLTNYHVISEKWPVGETIAQPSRPDGGSCPANVVGASVRSILSENVDGAVASITARGKKCAIHEIGDVKGKAAAVNDMPVRKRGRTTGLTHGVVDSVDATVNVPYDDGVHTLRHQILINVDTARSSVFGQGGDSGSVVVNADNKVVGLYFAGSEDGTLGVANPIDAVLDELNVDLCIGGSKSIYIEKPVFREKYSGEKYFYREVIKDRFKEVAYDKPPFAEAIDWGIDWRVNPPVLQQPIDVPAGPRDQLSIEERLAQLEALIASGGPPGQQAAPAAPAATPQPAYFPTLLVCSDFRALAIGFGPNPRTDNGATFHVHTYTGAAAAQTRIVNWGGLRGLDAGFRTVVTHPATSEVQVTLVRWATAPVLRAYNAANAVVSSATMSVAQGAEQTLTLAGAGIVRVEIRSPQNEIVLRRYCRRTAKSIKEFVKDKLEKPEQKEFKEYKEVKEFKEFKEKPEHKEVFETGPGLPDNPLQATAPESGGSVEDRLVRLEALIGGAHFIDPSLRPDLSGGALLGEEDAAAGSGQPSDCQCG